MILFVSAYTLMGMLLALGSPGVDAAVSDVPVNNYNLTCSGGNGRKKVTVRPSTTGSPTMAPTTGSPTRAPIKEKTPPPTRDDAPDTRRRLPWDPNEGSRAASTWGDPHITTFDGLAFDCQARGDVVMMRSMNSKFAIHGRFGRPANQASRVVSWTTGVTIREGDDDMPLVQMSLPNPWDSCDKVVYIDGNLIDPSNNIDHPDVDIYVKDGGKELVVEYWNGLKVSVEERARSHFGCSLTTRVRMPLSFREREKFIGLWGTPNGDKEDDWMDVNGNEIRRATSGLKGKAAYEYCTRWCIKNKTETLFDYNHGEVFEDLQDCEPIIDDFEDYLQNVPDWVTQACAQASADTRHDCILDTLAGDNPDNHFRDELRAQEESFNTMKWTVCGDRTQNSCILDEGANEILAGQASVRHIGCCSDSDEQGWAYHADSDTYSSQAVGGQCQSGTFPEADKVCKDAGARLCTRKEVMDGALSVGSCDLKKKLVWTSSDPSGALAFKNWVVCGASGRCPDNFGRPAHMDDREHEYAVRCCSDTPKAGWGKNTGCSVYTKSDLPGCFEAEDLFSADALCKIAGARLCTKEEVLDGCTEGGGCMFDEAFAWTSTPGVQEIPPPPKAEDPYVGVAKKWLACGNRLSSECMKRKGSNSYLDVVSHDHEVLCCSSSSLPGWLESSECPGVFSLAELPGEGCASMTHQDAALACQAAGGDLCSRDQVLRGCARESVDKCNYGDKLVWSADSPTGELSWGNWIGCGRKDYCPNENNGASGAVADPTSLHEVRCCSDDFRQGWKQHSGCKVWSSSDFGKGCPVLNLLDAIGHCSSVGARLCTKEELENNCAREGGCQFDKEFSWTSTTAWKTELSGISGSEPFRPELDPAVLDKQPKKWLACGDRKKPNCVQREGAYEIIAAIGEKHEVRCCASGSKPDGAGWKKPSPNTCPDVWGASEIPTCFHAETYSSAEQICNDYGGRLCTMSEIQAGCTVTTGCSHDDDLVWTSAPVDEASITGVTANRALTTVGGTVDTGMNWLACGSPQQCKENYGVGAVLAPHSQKHEVRCCSDDFKEGWTQSNGCQVYAESEINGICYHAETYQSAWEVCEGQGARLCTKEELVSGCAQGTGCDHDQDFIWSSTRGWALKGPDVNQDDKKWIACVGTSATDCIKANGSTKAIAAVPELHPTVCCSDQWTSGSGCSRGALVGSNSPVTFVEASNKCTQLNGDLCTEEEISGGCAAGLGMDTSMSWTKTEMNEVVEEFNWVTCGRAGDCVELFGRSGRLASSEEKHEVRCCSDQEYDGWIKHDFCEVYTQSIFSAPDGGDLCHARKTLAEATRICDDAGARLCTKKELLDDCTTTSGCSFDKQLVWSSDKGWKVESTEDELYWIACGAHDDNCIKNEGAEEIIANEFEQHEVRCCDEDDRSADGWTKQADCDVWAASYLPECIHAATYQDAENVCKEQNARLCTKDEVKNKCTGSSGCDHDTDLVWTKDKVESGAVTKKQWVQCGAKGRCGDVGGMLVDPTETHEVRCCSPYYRDKFSKKGHCDVYGASSVPDCMYGATFTEAKQACHDIGARLCTKQELLQDCTAATGCGHDEAYVWTDTEGYEIAL